jgi:beta-glucanase (GH16 family)
MPNHDADRDLDVVWSDDFDGPAGEGPDPAVWGAELGGGGWGCGQAQVYTTPPANASLDGDGHLAIVARRGMGGEDGASDAATSAVVTSARLVTKGRLHVRCGRAEARIKVPAGRGLWPAFQMLGADIDEVGWPACGEIDVMEVVGSQPTVVHGTLHGPGYAGLEHGVGRGHDAGVDLSADFHVYGVDWAPDRVTWRLDGVPYSTLSSEDVPGDRWPFTHAFYLLINLAVGGDWPGNACADPPLPATMLIDWVRIHGGTVVVGGE